MTPADSLGGAPKASKKAKGEGNRSTNSQASLARSQQLAFESITQSMAFEGVWEGEAYKILYSAEQASRDPAQPSSPPPPPPPRPPLLLSFSRLTPSLPLPLSRL